jgi:hypothetical protein
VVDIDTEVDNDLDKIIGEMDSFDLALHGLARGEDTEVIEATWLNIRNAMRRGDRGAASQMIADMAYSQAGVILPPLH